MNTNRNFTLASLAGGAVCIILSLLYSNSLSLIAASGFFALSIFLWKYGYLFIPLITSATRLIEIRDGYEVSSERDYIIKKTASGYLATKFLEIRFYESSSDKDKEQKLILFDSFEKTLSSLKYLVRISLMINAIDLSSHIDEIKTKRSALESKKSNKTRLSEDESLRLERELAYWNRLLERLSQGERPLELIAFASTTSSGLTKEEVISKVFNQAKELKTILSSSLGADIAELKDLDMLRCFEWEKFNPPDEKELKDQIF